MTDIKTSTPIQAKAREYAKEDFIEEQQAVAEVAFEDGALWVLEEVERQAKAINGFRIGTMTIFNAISIETLEEIIQKIRGK